MKINALASPDARRLDDDRQREALAAGSFDDELDAARNEPDELKPDDTDGRARDPRDERDDNAAALSGDPHDPNRPLDQRALAEATLERGARAFALGGDAGPQRATHLGTQANQLLAAQAALPEGAADIDQIRFSAAAEAASAGIDVAAAEPAFDAFAAVLSSFPGEDDESDALDLADGDGGAFDSRNDLRAPEAPKDTRPHQTIRDDAQLATKIADAVNELAASSAERSDVVRFRTAAYTFAAVIRQDVGASQVRLVSDDPNVRAFLGDRLPEVRQALERVGFASTGLSVAADSSSRHHERQHDQAPTDDDDRDQPRVGAATPRRARTSAEPPIEGPTGDARGLHLIV